MTSDPFQLRREKTADTVTLHRVSFFIPKEQTPGREWASVRANKDLFNFYYH